MSRRILLVEDDPISLDIIRAMLTGQGHHVDVATDGFSALDQARAVRYEAVLVDYHLPEMDGYALGRLLGERRSADGYGPVLIGLTADRNGLAARRGADAVFRAILPKPIKPAELFETIERLCAEAAAASDGSDLSAPNEPSSDAARRSTADLWRDHGISHHPRVHACPPPSADQTAALGLCFDLVDAGRAELVVLLERHGIGEAMRVARRQQGARLPIVGLSADHADICDMLFSVRDMASWSRLADLLGVAPPAVATPAATRMAPSAPVVGAMSPERLAHESVRLPAQPATPEGLDLHQLVLKGLVEPLAVLQAAAVRDAEGLDRSTLADVQQVAGALCDFLKPATGGDAATEAFCPAELIENAVAMIAGSGKDQAGLSWSTVGLLPERMVGDAHRFCQILLMALDDAVHAHPQGSITVQVALAGTEAPALSVRLGRPCEATAPAASSPLRTLRIATLAKQVAAGGGTLTLDPESGMPEVFTMPARPVSMPIAVPDADTPPAARVLLICDAAASGEITTLLLKQAGHDVCRVSDGTGALLVCKTSSNDIALFDIPNAPEARLLAFDAISCLHAAGNGMPVVAMAAGLTEGERERLEMMGLAEILAKPFRPEMLGQVVARCRRKAAARTPAASADILDRATHDGLVVALGVEAVSRLSAQLLDEVERLSAPEELTVAQGNAKRLTELADCATMLGLSELASCCAAFQEVASGGTPAGLVVVAAKAAVRRAQNALAMTVLAA